MNAISPLNEKQLPIQNPAARLETADGANVKQRRALDFSARGRRSLASDQEESFGALRRLLVVAK